MSRNQQVVLPPSDQVHCQSVLMLSTAAHSRMTSSDTHSLCSQKSLSDPACCIADTFTGFLGCALEDKKCLSFPSDPKLLG